MMTSPYQYVLVRYVPNVVRDEAVNVGVMVRSADGKQFAFKFLPRSATVRRLWLGADQQLVGNFEQALERCWHSGRPMGSLGHPRDEDFLVRARAEFNGNLQLTEPRGTLAAAADQALDQIYRTFVAEPHSGPRPINYQSIASYSLRNKLWTAFQKGELLRPDRVQKTMVLAGVHAPWTFDLGYRNGRLNVINSIAVNAPTLETNLGRSLVFKGMIDEVRQAQEVSLHATAVLQGAPADHPVPGAEEAEGILRDAGIEICDVTEIGVLVQRVESELAHAAHQ